TFGRGIYILDDYTPLRNLTKETLNKDAYIFPVKDAPMFVEASPFGFPGVGFQGANFYSASNPKIGAVFTYYLKDDIKSLKDKRRDEEKENQKKKEDIKYPSYNSLVNEKEEPKAYLLFTVTDENGNVIRKLKTEPKKGVNRIVWDFRYNPFTAVSLKPFDSSIPWNQPDLGYMVVPGKYKVSLSKFQDGRFTELVPPQDFVCKPLNNTSIPAEDKPALDKFNKKVAELTRAISGADEYRKLLDDKIKYLEKAVIDGAGVPDESYNTVIKIKKELDDFNRKLNGDPLLANYEGASPTSVKQHVDLITSSLWNTTSAPTETYIKSYDYAAEQFGGLLTKLKSIDDEVKNLESKLEEYGAPYTPGRFPEWKKDSK
ncbi:MAG: glycosyl hydrolase, partial [Ignavibacteriaceae bacterium]